MMMGAFVGCGRSGPSRTELVGEVSLDGTPVAQAQVYLSAKAANLKIPGTYSAYVVDGSFDFSRSQGPPPGEYDLTFKPVEEDAEEVFQRIREKKRNALAERDKFLSAVARKCPMRVMLSAEDVNVVTVNLTSR